MMASSRSVAGVDPGDARVLVAEAIRSRAERRGLSLRALAQEAGTSRGYMDKVIACQSSPTIDWLCRIAAVLECHPRDLLPRGH